MTSPKMKYKGSEKPIKATKVTELPVIEQPGNEQIRDATKGKPTPNGGA